SSPFLSSLSLSLSQLSTFPIPWKNTVVFPIPKRDDLSDPNNYHSISPSPIISKVFVTFISDQLRAFLEREGLLSGRQYKCRPSRSTGDILALVSLLVGCTRQPRRNTSRSTSLGHLTEFGTKSFWRNCPRSDFPPLSYRGHKVFSIKARIPIPAVVVEGIVE
ncbi:hypothetical protein D915_004959, partial [Fasciola hepatica]